jgi:glutaredoxin 3
MFDNVKSPHYIRLFSNQDCPYCHTLRAFLDENGFSYEDINLTKKMEKEMGQKGVPVIEIDGETIVGFDREKIIKLLGIKE